MKTRDEIIAENPLAEFMAARGIALKGPAAKPVTNVCGGHEHKPGHLCVSIDPQRQVWRCNDCETGGSVIDFVMLADGLPVKEAMAKLANEWLGTSEKAPPRPSAQPSAPPGPLRVVAAYDYRDEKGALLFQVCRCEPKTFRQRHKGPDGQWVYKMEGIRRVLYNLPAVVKADFVWIVEGEKDADLLNSLGMVATCNPGGALKWDDSYTESLKDKEIVLCGDTDDAGQKHVARILAEVTGKVRTSRVVKVPAPHKDVSEWLASDPSAGPGLCNLAESAEVFTRGVRLPIRSMAELEREYIHFARNAPMTALRISDWLPSTLGAIRPIVPGEMVAILAGTGVGKTMILQNLALHTGIPTLMFELELPGTLTFERFVSMAVRECGRKVAELYYEGRGPDWKATGRLGHIHVCTESKMSPAELERIVNSAGIKTGIRPALVLLDYIQLMQGKGDRRERISDAAEELKVIAKATNTIIVLTSQISRKTTDKKPGQNENEVYLTDAKESGSIENSCGLVLGVWKTSRERMMIKVLKNTKGVGGKIIACDIKEGLRIEEAPTKDQPKEP